MIKALRKKISVLLLFLVGILLLGILVVLNQNVYRQNLTELKSDVYQTIHEAGWSDFFVSGDELVDMGDLEYCVFAVDDDRNVTIHNNHYPGMSEQKLLEYGQKIASHWKGTDDYYGITYIYARTRKVGRFIVIISAEEAREASFPVLIGSIAAGLLCMLLFWLAAKRLSRWMVQPIEEMIDSEKLFMSNASHELKTPLTVIQTNSELLAGEIGENRHLQYIQQETDRMIAMVGKMLTLVRLDSPALEEPHERYCVDEALWDVIYPLESVAYEKQIQIETNIAQDIYLSGDAERMKSVMSILLDNAISYTKEGGRIRITAGMHSGKFQLSVANTGDAIPPELRERLFERFFRADEARADAEQHFGLGLSIAGRIVENRHGKIWAESKNGENIFHVTLPR